MTLARLEARRRLGLGFRLGFFLRFLGVVDHFEERSDFGDHQLLPCDFLLDGIACGALAVELLEKHLGSASANASGLELFDLFSHDGAATL